MVRTYVKKSDRPQRVRFIALDGEGLNVNDRPQPYVLLASSADADGHLWSDDENGLTTEECLSYLCNLARKNRGAVFVGYGLSYDFNQILRNIPGGVLRKIQGYTDKNGKRHESNYTSWQAADGVNYVLRYRARKELWIAINNPQWKSYLKPSVNNQKYLLSFSIWDVHGFFQLSFVKAIRSYLGELPELGIIDLGKEKRADFQPENKQFMIDYNAAECELLVLLMNKLEENLHSANLPVKRWDGAGAVAASLMQREKVKLHYGTQPPEVIRAGEYAYAGGHIEAFKIGSTKYMQKSDVYHYDIRSAYPDGISRLPSLAEGNWKHYDFRRLNIEVSDRTDYSKLIPTLPSFAVWRIEWDLGDDDNESPFYPFPFREQSSVIRFPRRGHNWIWAPEINSFLKNRHVWKNGKFIIHEGWVFYPSIQTPPFKFVHDLYNLRAELKKKKDGAEKAIKLAINSFYGKMAQHVGYSESDNGQIVKPPFHNILYAGHVTSHTRALLLDAACQAPSSIIAIATDGIFSTVPLNLPISDELGDWEESQHSWMTIVQSGVYWIANENEVFSYYRGFDPDSIQHDDVLKAWKKKESTMSVPSSRFITLGTALRSIEQWKQWRMWIKPDKETGVGMRELKLTPHGTKRFYAGPQKDYQPHKHLVDTLSTPAEHFEANITDFSCRYPLPWEMENREDMIAKDLEAENEDVWI